jgi:transposase
MMGRQTVDQGQLFYLFNLEKRIPERHLLRHINPTVTRILAEFREKLEPFYNGIGRPSIDPELMIRMLIVGYCYGTRFDRKPISARQTCLCGALRSRASTFRRRRSAGLRVMKIPVRVRQTRMHPVRWESPLGFKCQTRSTRPATR